MAIFVKLPPNSEHLLITENFFKTRRYPLFRGFTVLSFLNIITSDLKGESKNYVSYKSICKYVLVGYVLNNFSDGPSYSFTRFSS